jgi:hypothetical protein
MIFTTSHHLARLLKAAPRHPHLKLIVVIDELEPEAKRLAEAWSQAQGVQLEELNECRSWVIVCLYFFSYTAQFSRELRKEAPSRYHSPLAK